MFKQILTSIGIGSAKVDTHLAEEYYAPGDWLTGEVHIAGGMVAQEIDHVYLQIMATYQRKIDKDNTIEETCTLAKHRLNEPFQIAPDELRVLPFRFQLAWRTPLTVERRNAYLYTGLDIPLAIDPGDRDYLKVVPTPLMEHIFDAMSRLGFKLRESDCEYQPHLGNPFPFVQEFEFQPTGSYRKKLEELEVVFFPDAEGVTIKLELDRRARGLWGHLEEALGTDERHLTLRFDNQKLNDSAETIARQLNDVLGRYSR